jgi:hypothetical protein
MGSAGSLPAERDRCANLAGPYQQQEDTVIIMNVDFGAIATGKPAGNRSRICQPRRHPDEQGYLHSQAKETFGKSTLNRLFQPSG